MATLYSESSGCRRIQFHLNGRRKSIRLGKLTQRQAEAVRIKIEALVAAKQSNLPMDGETSAWLSQLADEFHAKLAVTGLVPAKENAALGPFLERHIASRTDIKPATLRWYTDVQADLIARIGASKRMPDITPVDADGIRLYLEGKGLGPNTIRRRIGICRQIFNAAKRYKLIQDNPFAGMATEVRSNPDKFRYVTQEETKAILEHCPDATWKAIVCLVRYGGLRCPSEVLSVQWGHVNWENSRLTVPSPKTAHHEGKSSRVIPLFPELQLALSEALEQAPPGAQFIVQRYRSSTVNLRTLLERIIIKAGVAPWPKLFINLRSSRETELIKDFPIHTVTAWLGNSPRIAMKHYLQVTDDDYAKAIGISKQSVVRNPVQQAPEMPGKETNRQSPEDANTANCGDLQSYARKYMSQDARGRSRNPDCPKERRIGRRAIHPTAQPKPKRPMRRTRLHPSVAARHPPTMPMAIWPPEV